MLPPLLRGAPPSERIGVGLIGIGCMGRGHLHLLANHPAVQLLAVCDVDRERRETAKAFVEETYAAERAKGSYRGCAAYNDYRELLARPDIDAVVIVTPDHWHSLLAAEAARAGKDVYCEKPVSLTIHESRRMVETVRRYGRVFQTGTQYRSITTIRHICQFIRDGGLGKVKSVFTLWGKVHAPKVTALYVPQDPLLPAEPVPDGLDWDLWVGPASWHAYSHHYHRNPVPGVVPWVFCDAFGAGAVTGYHSHAADVIQYAIGMERSGPVEIIHPGSGEFPTLTCRYANGTLLHHVEHWGQVRELYHAVPADARLAGNFGGVFIGERGWVTTMTTGGPVEGGPEKLFKALDLKTREVNPGDNNHHANWFECIRTRRSPSSNEEIGHRSASLGHLVGIAYQLGRSLKWNPAKEKFVGDDEANRLRSRAMREPWQI
ncbi:MAG: Gfo/Idh/MocA family oxidoreductase [Verrucomicrobia bacterium]|nr:Gfo/Idh/MocA family oxidoreductase [Verrucomicrobiota bacterium]